MLFLSFYDQRLTILKQTIFYDQYNYRKQEGLSNRLLSATFCLFHDLTFLIARFSSIFNALHFKKLTAYLSSSHITHSPDVFS